MLTKELLAAADDFQIHDVRCSAARSPWSSPEPTLEHAVVFVRRGCFRRRVGRAEILVDPTVVYFERPGQEQEVAHPCVRAARPRAQGSVASWPGTCFATPCCRS